MKLSKVALGLSALLVIGFPSLASASTYSFGQALNTTSPTPNQIIADLGLNYIGTTAVPTQQCTGNGSKQICVDVTETWYEYNFKLTSNNMAAIFGGTPYIDSLLINTSDVTKAQLTGTQTSGVKGSTANTGTVGALSIANNAGGEAGINWEFKFNAPNSASGDPDPRLNSLEWISWNVLFNDELALQIPEFGIHVNSMANGQSGWYKPGNPPPPVPLPAAAWLFGSALIGFVTLSNRRKV